MRRKTRYNVYRPYGGVGTMRDINDTVENAFARDRVLDEVRRERIRQDEKWGEQHHPDGTSEARQVHAILAKNATDNAAKNGTLSWLDILQEEAFEASAETDQALLRAELIQVAAVAVAWVEDIDRRSR